MPESRNKLKMPIGIGIISVLAVYLAIYMVLSAMGDYVECGRGLGGYRIYRWQPCAVKDHGRPTAWFYVGLLAGYQMDTSRKRRLGFG